MAAGARCGVRLVPREEVLGGQVRKLGSAAREPRTGTQAFERRKCRSLDKPEVGLPQAAPGCQGHALGRETLVHMISSAGASGGSCGHRALCRLSRRESHRGRGRNPANIIIV